MWDTYVGRFLSWYDLIIVYLYNLCDSAVFCVLLDQLASLDRHAQVGVESDNNKQREYAEQSVSNSL